MCGGHDGALALWFCRRADDDSFSVRLHVRGSTPPDPGDRRDLSNTFGQLSSPNPTPIRRRLYLPRIGERNSDGNIRAMILDLSNEEIGALVVGKPVLVAGRNRTRMSKEGVPR